jgi:hypothetical protein
MYVMFRLGSLVRLLVFIAVVAVLVGAMVATGQRDQDNPGVNTPPAPPATTTLPPVNLAPRG